MIAYLAANNYTASAAALREELNLDESQYDATTAKKYETLLEKKWTSVIMDLESRNNALQSEVDNATPGSLMLRNKDPASWLPKAPPRYTLESHRNAINCIAFHPTFSSLATGSDDFTIKIWDWDIGELEKTIKGHTRAVLDVDYGGPKGNVLLVSCSSDLAIKLWDPADDYKNIRTLSGHDHSVSAVRFIPNSANLLVSASRDMTLKIWDVTTGFVVRTLHGHTAWVRDVVPAFDGRYLVSCGDDMTARLWDITSVATTNESKLTLYGHEHYIECCALAPPSAYVHLAQMAGLKRPPSAASSAEFVATGSRDKMIRLWDARGTCLRTLIGHDNWIRSLVFHPGGKFLLSAADDKTVRCWDLAQEGRCVKVISDPHERFVTSLRWAPSLVRSAGGTDQLAAGLSGTGADQNGNGRTDTTTVAANGTRTKEPQDVQIRCVVATGCVDSTEHLPAIEAASELELKAIYSRSQKTAETLHAKAGSSSAVDVYFDEPATAGRGLADLLARSDVAAVAVGIPITLQPAVVRQALAAGKHVISEKPVAATVAEARELIAEYEQMSSSSSSRPLWAVAENYRYQPGLQVAVAEARRLGGELVSFSLHSDRLVRDETSGGYINTSWRRQPTHPGGFLLDGGVHFVAALRQLMGSLGSLGDASEIARLACFAAQLQPHLPPVDTLRGVAVTRGGVSGVLNMSFGTEFGGPLLEVVVTTTEGRLTWTPRCVTVMRRGDVTPAVIDTADPAAFPAAEANGVKAEFAAFARSIATGAAAVDQLQSPREALQDLLVVETMLQSGAEGGALREL
ncbi:nuclear migration protein [Grosmannia clavigera kw1407]|uniref:Nuclear distribution protein PAC1 n=1 Tax=Grosmannia clavigera (strain kw1407 / UAMH 11150) TaxID=655863 RepID=F0XCK6_GROCL|nr:nuclear migration protein [Grosmannia clavigera kw1407]EFX03707.1 nuclear migration protein [Grosmannia clavigera kw1407]